MGKRIVERAKLLNPKRTCFAYSEGECNVTNNIDCKNCAFYKTHARLIAELERTEKRIANKYGVPYKSFIKGKRSYE